MFLCFFFRFSLEIFRFNYDKLYAKPGDPIEIMFTGMKTSEEPLVFSFDHHDLLCPQQKNKQIYRSFGDNLLGFYSQRTSIQTKFLIDNNSQSCACRHTIKNSHKSQIKRLIRNKFLLGFRLDSFHLSNEGNKGILVGIHDMINNHFNFFIHYHKIEEDLYEIVGFTGTPESTVHYELHKGFCSKSLQPFVIQNFTDLSYTYSIHFIDSKLEPPSLSSFDQQERANVHHERKIDVDSSCCCELCKNPIFSGRFIIFPCNHAVHISCYLENMDLYFSPADQLSLIAYQSSALKNPNSRNNLLELLSDSCPICGERAVSVLDKDFVIDDPEEKDKWSLV